MRPVNGSQTQLLWGLVAKMGFPRKSLAVVATRTVSARRSDRSLAVESRTKGLGLTRQERLEVRRRIAAGESFEQAGNAVRCTTKTVQRLINAVAGLQPRDGIVPSRGSRSSSGRRSRGA